MRPASITDQLYIKAQRIRTLEEKKVSKVGEGITDEYIGIVNYCIIGILQLQLGTSFNALLPPDAVHKQYEQTVNETKELMLAKNHDSDQACRKMRLTSLTDPILQKLYRVTQLPTTEDQTQTPAEIN